MLSNWEWQAKKTKDLLIGGTRQCFLCLPSALWYSMQSFQWLCLIFFLSNLPLSQGYEALHGIPSLKKTQIIASPPLWLHFSPHSWHFLHPVSMFPLSSPSEHHAWKAPSRTAVLHATLHTACSPFKHFSSASACSLHCWNTVIKDDRLSLSFNGCPARQSGRCERYLCSTAKTGSGAQLLINLNHSHKEKPLYSTMTISWIYTANGRIAVLAACWMETSNHSPGHCDISLLYTRTGEIQEWIKNLYESN